MRSRALSENLASRPAARGEPVNIEINYFLLGLTDIVKGGEQTFAVDMYFNCHWHDPRLCGLDSDIIDWSNVWKPDVEITNAREAENTPQSITVDSDGNVKQETRFRATCVADYMDLTRFPFDAQLLNIGFEPSEHAADEVTLRMLQDTGSHIQSNLVRPGGLAEWDIASCRELHSINVLEFDQTKWANVEVQIVVCRKHGYYLKKILFTCGLINIMSWTVFFLDPADVGDRIGISSTIALTVIAFNSIVNESLPRISYMTKMDIYLTFMFTSVVLTALENVVVFKMVKTHPTAATDLDDLCFRASVFLAVASTAWFLVGGWYHRRQADTNRDGVLDAVEVEAMHAEDGRTSVLSAVTKQLGVAAAGAVLVFGWWYSVDAGAVLLVGVVGAALCCHLGLLLATRPERKN